MDLLKIVFLSHISYVNTTYGSYLIIFDLFAFLIQCHKYLGYFQLIQTVLLQYH